VPVTDVVTATYTALSTDYFLCVLTNGLVTITLPTGILGTVYIVKDCFGDAANNPITIQGTGGQTIDGNATATINADYGSITLIFEGTDWSIV
jgi:predicted dehydrogenase